MQISARNQLKGKIVEIQIASIMAEVVVELPDGQHIVSAITSGSVDKLNLQVGDEVIAVVKSTEVMIGKE